MQLLPANKPRNPEPHLEQGDYRHVQNLEHLLFIFLGNYFAILAFWESFLAADCMKYFAKSSSQKKI